MKKTYILILTILTFLFTFSFINVKAEDTYDSSIKLGDIPSSTIANSYNLIEKDGMTIQAYAGFFDAENASNNYGLVKFDTTNGDNSISASSKTGLIFENWKYIFNNNSVVIEITATSKGTLTFDTSLSTTFGGWIDWNSAYIVRKLTANGTLSDITFNYHISNEPDATIKAAYLNGFTQELETGDKIYIELGASSERNYQNMQESILGYKKYIAPKEDLTLSTIQFQNIPYYTWYYDYGTIKTTDFVINTYAGFFDNEKENYGLTAFDGHSDDNTVTCSTKEDLTFNNWQYSFNNNSIVLAFKASKKGVFTIDYSNCTVGGWIDWNSAYIVRLVSKDGTVSNLVYDYKLSEDGNEDYNKNTILSALSGSFSTCVEEGDTLYIEFGAATNRNYQGLNNATITFATETKEMTDAVSEMTNAYNALYNTDYTTDDYKAIKDLLDKNTALIYNTVNESEITSYKNEFLELIENTKTNLNFFNIPYFVNVNNFGYYNGKFISYSAYTGRARSLLALDTKVDDNTIKSSTIKDIELLNWRYTFTASNAIIIAIKANKNVKIDLAKTGDNIGYMEDALYNVYLSTDGKVYLISSETISQSSDINNTYYLKQNDELYLEFVCVSTCEGTRNFQLGDSMNLTSFTDFNEALYNTQNSLITAIENKKNDLKNYVSTLKEEDYSASSWITINNYVSEFDSNALDMLNENDLTSLYDTAKNNIDDVLTLKEAEENLNKYREEIINQLKEYYDDLLENNHYTSEGKKSLDTIYNDAIKEIKVLSTIEAIENKLSLVKNELDGVEIDAIYDEKIAALNEVNEEFSLINKAYYDETKYGEVETKVNIFIENIDMFTSTEEITDAMNTVITAIKSLTKDKDGVNYIDIPLNVYNNGFDWVKGSLFDYTAKTGNVEDGLVNFNTYNETDNSLSASSIMGTKMQNWKWFIMPDNGIILIFKANSDIKLSIVDSRISDGRGNNGWTDDCTLIYYIVRDEVVKTIKTVAKPTTDADFSGDFYLKSGDILYVEFNTTFATSERNTEAPFMTSVVASNDFDEELYIEQNHDLSKEVKTLVETKIKELNDYVSTLKEEEYSATNWSNIIEYRDTFISTVADKVTTIDDVNKEYQAAIDNINSVQTKAQAEAEINNYLESVKQSIKEAYEELINNNNYTDDNKAALDKAYNAAIEEINAAQSKVQANAAKVKALQTMNAIEKTIKEEEKSMFDFGCENSIASSIFMTITISIALVFVARKRKKEYN